MKATFLTLVAILFGLGQYCNCAYAQLQPLTEVNGEHSLHADASGTLAADHDVLSGHALHDGDENSTSTTDDGCSVDCDQCDNHADYVLAADGIKLLTANFSAPQTTQIQLLAAPARASPAPRLQTVLRWTDRPALVTTPITLKMRLLI